MPVRSTDLNDPAAPDGVARILRNAADLMREQASELDSAWQDKGAGKPWDMIAKELEACATKIERKL